MLCREGMNTLKDLFDPIVEPSRGTNSPKDLIEVAFEDLSWVLEEKQK